VPFIREKRTKEKLGKQNTISREKINKEKTRDLITIKISKDIKKL